MRDNYTRDQVLELLKVAGVANPESLVNGDVTIPCHADEGDYLIVKALNPKATAFDLITHEGRNQSAMTLNRAKALKLIDVLYERLADLD